MKSSYTILKNEKDLHPKINGIKMTYNPPVLFAKSESDKIGKIVFDSNTDVIVTTRLSDDIIVDINKKDSLIYGYKASEIIGKKSKELNIFEDYNRREQLLNLVNDQGIVKEFEVVLISKLGAIKNCLFFTEKTKLKNEFYLITRIRDITIQKNAEKLLRNYNEELESRVNERTKELSLMNNKLKEEIDKHKKTSKLLKESEVRYRNLHGLTFEGIIIHDKGIAIDMNPALVKMFGYSREELLGKNIVELLAQKEFHRIIYENIIEKYALSYEVNGVRKDGSVFPIELEARSIKLEKDNKLFRVTAVRDISLRKKAELEFIEIKNQLSDSQQIAKLGSWELNLKTKIITLSAEHQLLIGEEAKRTSMPLFEYAEKYIISEDISVIQEKMDFAVQNIENRHYSDNFEYRLKTNEDEIKYFAIKSSFKSSDTIIGVTQDITEQKLSANKLELHNQHLEILTTILQNQFSSTMEMLDYALGKALELTQSKLGYIYYYNEEKKQFILHSWSGDAMKECRVMDRQTVYDLEKTGCWGEAVRKRKPYLINDYSKPNKDIKGIPEGHVELKKFLSVPVMAEGVIKAVVGVANKECDYTNSDIKQLALLMDTLWKNVEKKQYEEDLIAAKEKAEESDRLKSAFLANMSHEIRTPMNGILGFAGLLKEPGLSSDTQQRYISIIEKSGTRMVNTLHNLVDISKIETGQINISISEFNVNKKIDDLRQFFEPEAEKKGIQLSFKKGLSTHESIIESDNEKLNTILTNLIKNAIKYTEEGKVEIGYSLKGSTSKSSVIESSVAESSVTESSVADFSVTESSVTESSVTESSVTESSVADFSVTESSVAEFSVAESSVAESSVGESSVAEPVEANELEFYIKDTGIGIPKDRQEAIFERFIQADIEDKMALEGTGLGLSIAKAYVELLSGKIWVKSKLGVGTQFYFTIPYNNPEKELIKGNEDGLINKPEPKIKKLKILIVDDEEISKFLLAESLDKIEKEFLYADTGRKALEQCRKNSDIDLVLMDVRMPDMDGYEATRRIREFNKDVVIIAQTAFAQKGDKEKSLEAGCDYYLTKPINRKKLHSLIYTIFSESLELEVS